MATNHSYVENLYSYTYTHIPERTVQNPELEFYLASGIQQRRPSYLCSLRAPLLDACGHGVKHAIYLYMWLSCRKGHCCNNSICCHFQSLAATSISESYCDIILWVLDRHTAKTLCISYMNTRSFYVNADYLKKADCRF